jgi:hypothetical protein
MRDRGGRSHRVENPGWNDTKSAFADCAAGYGAQGRQPCGLIKVGWNVRGPRLWRDESAKADFVLL